MSKLTKQIKLCGIHDCKHECFAISESEARKAIEEVKKACIEAVEYRYRESKILTFESCIPAVEAIKSVK